MIKIGWKNRLMSKISSADIEPVDGMRVIALSEIDNKIIPKHIIGTIRKTRKSSVITIKWSEKLSFMWGENKDTWESSRTQWDNGTFQILHK